MQIARLTDRLKRIDAIEDRFVQFIELADDVTAHSRLVEQHGGRTMVRPQVEETFNRSIPAKILTTIERVAERETPFQRSNRKEFSAMDVSLAKLLAAGSDGCFAERAVSSQVGPS